MMSLWSWNVSYERVKDPGVGVDGVGGSSLLYQLRQKFINFLPCDFVELFYREVSKELVKDSALLICSPEPHGFLSPLLSRQEVFLYDL